MKQQEGKNQRRTPARQQGVAHPAQIPDLRQFRPPENWQKKKPAEASAGFEPNLRSAQDVTNQGRARRHEQGDTVLARTASCRHDL